VPVIPRALLPSATARATPFTYSQADLDGLLGACPAVFANARVAATVRVVCVIGPSRVPEPPGLSPAFRIGLLAGQ